MKVSLAKGTQDFLPTSAVPRREVIGLITEVFERYGFDPLETPAFERLETLLGKYGDEGDKLIFKILKRGEGELRGEADLALRYDLTVPLARVVAMYSELPRPFKRYQIAPVWRAEKPQRGRYREFYQCDVDVAGSTSPLVEVELLTMVQEAYSGLGLKDFFIQLNHRQVLRGLIHAAGIPDSEEITTLVILDKLDKIGSDGVMQELQARGLTVPQLAHLEALIALKGDNHTLLSAMEHLVGAHEGARLGIENLRAILEGTRAAGVPAERIRVTPVLARGLGYYTGAIYEVGLPDFPSSIGAGGRYDGLVGLFSGREVPACGISFGLDRILLLLGERGLLSHRGSRTQVLVPIFSEEVQGEALALAGELRAAGLRVDVYPEPGKLGKQMQYGSAKGIPLAVVVGPDELARGEVLVRELDTRAQHACARKDVSARVRELLAVAGS